MMVRVHSRLQHLDIFGNQVVLFLISEYLAYTQVTLCYDPELISFTRYIDARGTILCICVNIVLRVSLYTSIHLEVSPHISSLLGFHHLLIAALFVVQYVYLVGSV